MCRIFFCLLKSFLKVNYFLFFVLLITILYPECTGTPGQKGFNSDDCSRQDVRILQQITSLNPHIHDLFQLGNQTWEEGHLVKFKADNYGDRFRLNDIFQLKELKLLNLSHVEILDSMSAEIDNLQNLESLIINFTILSGNLNSGVGSLTKLTFLSLDHNNFSGIIPESIGNLVHLQGLSLDHNNFSGVIPGSIGNLVNLTHLHLDENAFSGELPNSIGKLENLRVLHLAYNELEKLPDSICKLSLQKMELTFYGNRFCEENTLPGCTVSLAGFQNCN